MVLINLNGNWKMRRCGEENYIEASVPGSVYNDLLYNKKMEDPFYRDNEVRALEVSKHNYEYKRNFYVNSEVLSHQKVILLCEGLDTLAEVFINGNSIGSTSDMHRTYKFDIRSFIRIGENDICIRFSSPINYIISKDKQLHLFGGEMNGVPYIRKAHYMFGWDWGPKLPDMGIWKNISIEGYDNAKIDGVYISQYHKEGLVKLNVRVNIEEFQTDTREVVVKVTAPQGEVIKSSTITDFREANLEFKINNPSLWWPNGFGEHPLYKVEVTLLNDGNILDKQSYRIGLRTIRVAQEEDEWGKSFAFEVNGVKIFSMGANYVPQDSIISRVNREKTEKIIKSCIAANFNTIRVWGGGYYPEDYFYDLCDEYGIIVWQDQMYACCMYDFDDDFKENIIAETIDNMKRIRHHASLGLWCGNNEMESAWCDWGWSEKFSPKLKADYIKQFEMIIPEICKEIDPNTCYWPSSPSSGGCFDDPSSENSGDKHYWSVWHGRKPFTDYRNVFARFVSEFGLQSFPCLKTLESFTLPEDRNIFSYVMENHQKNNSGNDIILHYISETYKYPKDFDSLLYASQLIQAEGIKYGVEHWRRNRGRCMGAIYWQLNDCWPVASWASIDYFGRWKALHYLAKRFFAPVMASACEDDTDVDIYICNETMKKVSGKLICKLRNSKSEVIKAFENEVQINKLSSQKVQEFHFEGILDTIEKKRDSYLEYQFWYNDTLISSETVLFVKAKHFNFINPEINFEALEKEKSFLVKLTSKSFAKYVELQLNNHDAVFSDNYFDISAGEEKFIEIKKEDISGFITLDEIKSELKVRSLFDTF